MDALPIHETNKFSYKSKFDNRMHACGHDGHTTMLLGAAKYLSKKVTLTVRYILFFNLMKRIHLVQEQ